MQHSIGALVGRLHLLPIAHLMFLLTFDPPRTVDSCPRLPTMLPYTDWDEFLKDSPSQVTENLLSLGALVRSSLRTHLEHLFTKDALQVMLRERNLALTGSKSDLIERLVRTEELAMWSEVGDCMILECTPWAWQTAKTRLEGYIENDIESTLDHSSSMENLRNAIKWILAAAVAGIIGNRVDAAIVTLIEKVKQQIALKNSDSAYTPESPLQTPIHERIIYNLPSSKLTKSTVLYSSPHLTESVIPIDIPAGESVYVMGTNKSGSHLRVAWETGIGWVPVSFTDYNNRRNELKAFPIFERVMPACAEPIATLLSLNSEWSFGTRQNIIVIVDIFRPLSGKFPRSSLVLTLNGMEIESRRREITEQGQFLLINTAFHLQVEPNSTLGFQLQPDNTEQLIFIATIYHIPESCLSVYLFSRFPRAFSYSVSVNIAVRHLRELPGNQITEVVSFEERPSLDNSNGTKPLLVQIAFKRYYRHFININLALHSQKISSLMVRNWIAEMYDLPPEDPEGTIRQALGVLNVVIPPSQRAKIMVQWTELWAEGVINEGMKGDGDRLGNYKVFLGYTQPCSLVDQENLTL